MVLFCGVMSILYPYTIVTTYSKVVTLPTSLDFPQIISMVELLRPWNMSSVCNLKIIYVRRFSIVILLQALVYMLNEIFYSQT